MGIFQRLLNSSSEPTKTDAKVGYWLIENAPDGTATSSEVSREVWMKAPEEHRFYGTAEMVVELIRRSGNP